MESRCVIAEMVCEAIIGAAAGICLNRTVLSKCNWVEQTVVTLGAGIGGWALGRAFGEQFYQCCDENFDTRLSKWYSRRRG